MYKVGDQARLNVVVPEGTITKMRMDEDGTIWYLLSWDTEDVPQERWFTGAELTVVG